MHTNTSTSKQPNVGKRHQWPAVSIILPFEPVMKRKEDLMQRVQKAAKKVAWDMATNYDEDLTGLVILKLKAIIKNLNFNTFRKSIAIFVSPVYETVLYLNIPVVETITVDGSFGIRDILFAKREIPAFFVLMLSKKWSKVYEGNDTTLVKIKSNGVGHMAVIHDQAISETIPHGADNEHAQSISFLQHTDHGLQLLLQSMPLPLLVLGNKMLLKQFVLHSKSGNSIVACIPGNFESVTDEELFDVIKPHIADWNKIKVKDIYHQLEKAAANERLVTGIKAVRKDALRLRGNLLIVGKSMLDTAGLAGQEGIDVEFESGFNKFSCVKNVLDEIIERVLGSGGNVEVVDDGVLGDMGIAMVK